MKKDFREQVQDNKKTGMNQTASTGGSLKFVPVFCCNKV